MEAISNDAPLVFRGRLNEADVGHVQKYHDLLRLRRPIRWAAAFMLLLLAGIMIWWSLKSDYPSVAALSAVTWVYIVFIFPHERIWYARRLYRKNSAKFLETQATLSESRVAVENEDHTASYKWHLVGNVVITPHGLLFCNHELGPILWLPNRILADGLRDRVLKLAATSSVTIRRLT